MALIYTYILTDQICGHCGIHVQIQVSISTTGHIPGIYRNQYGYSNICIFCSHGLHASLYTGGGVERSRSCTRTFSVEGECAHTQVCTMYTLTYRYIYRYPLIPYRHTCRKKKERKVVGLTSCAKVKYSMVITGTLEEEPIFFFFFM